MVSSRDVDRRPGRPYPADVRVGILGAAEARLNGVAVDLGTRKQRALLAALAMRRGQPVSQDALVDMLWGESPPTAVTATLQGYVARLRRALEPDRAPRAASEVLVTQQSGYVLLLPEDAIDAAGFESAVVSAHDRLGAGMTTDLGAGELEEVYAAINDALSLWRGVPYTELEDAPAAQAERTRLEELRVIALEDRAVAALGLGRHAMVAGELEVLTSTYPLRERLWGLRALALTRSGRQADALEVLRQVRELLAEELGLEPGAELRALQTAVLRQDPALEWSATRPIPRQRASAAPTARSSTQFAWPLVGRDDQLSALVGLLEQSGETPAFAVVTGEPGIGKSRLCAELATTATAEGVTVLVGRCSQDEGAPPLYPWASILRELGHELPSGSATEGDGDSTSRFRAWESIARTVLDAAAEQHLLVVLDDLHWADTSTLRVLRLLSEMALSGRLMVVATWRHEPPPTGQLAQVAEMLARRHALRLHLDGLTAAEAGEIVTSVAETTPTANEADALRLRTDGNPFFLVEYARLARDGGDLPALLHEEHPPAAVQDVLTRRLGGLPEATSRTLNVACVIGRYFDVATLGSALGGDEDDVLDHLEPALQAGLLREFGVDRFRFAHALVRDTAYAAMSQSRRARVHARVAEVLSGRPGHESEVARHWLSAGPQQAPRAWRAAVDAAEAARRVYAYDEAVSLLRDAVTALEQDPSASDEDVFGVLLDLGRSELLTDNLVDLRTTVRRALSVAGRLDDPAPRELEAVELLTTNALWQTGSYGEADDVVVATSRRLLDRLPPGDSASRCRAMIALANEIYYTSSVREREALCDEALAMARRLGDDSMLLHTLLAAPLGIWSPASADLRFQILGEAADLARKLRDESSLATALCLRASSASESGRVAEMYPLIDEAREIATRERLLFAQLFLDGLEIAWRAMRDEFDRVQELTTHMVSIHERIGVPQSGDALIGAFLMDLLWRGRTEDLLSMTDQLAGVTVIPIHAPLAAVFGRAGRLDEAREWLLSPDLDLSPDWWFSTMTLSMAAEAAMYVGARDVAATAYDRLLRFSGMPACSGSGTVIGPVDAFLAMAAHATGQRDLASRHADEAVRLCTEWEIPLALSWFNALREQHPF